MIGPFPLPSDLDVSLVPVLSYWEKLKRGQAQIPFADDLRVAALKDAKSILILDVQGHPIRFRIAVAGKEIVSQHGGKDLEGLYLDELTASSPLNFLHSQASATVEAHAPTYYRNGKISRLMLPLWGDGWINMLLVAVS